MVTANSQESAGMSTLTYKLNDVIKYYFFRVLEFCYLQSEMIANVWYREL